MKYITTDKHPQLKKGVLIVKTIEQFQFTLGQTKTYFMSFVQADIWEKKGWIQKVEEKKFTKSDMKSYGTFASGVIWTQTTNRENIFNEWLKQRDK